MLRLQIETSGSAFDVDLGGKCADVLRVVADRLERGDYSGLYQSITDVNGNVCGTFRLKSCDCHDPCEHIR